MTGGFMAGSIVAKLVLDKTGWSQAVREIGTDTNRLLSKASEVSQGMTQVGRSMALAGASIVGFLGVALASFAKFDDAFVQSTAIMGDLTAEMTADLKAVARAVGRETTFAASEAAGAYFYLASAGLSVEESMKALPVVAKFAQAGMFGLERATTLLADAQAALGMRIQNDAVKNMENMIRVSDVLSKANILANANIEQFSEAITNRAGAALRMVGKDIEEGAAVLSQFANTGIKGAEAGTRLDIVMRDLQTRSIKNKAAFEKYNVTVFDGNGEMRNMADIIEDLEKAMAGLSDQGRRNALMQMDFQDRSVASILALIGFSSQIRQFEKQLRSAGGVTDEIAKKQLASLKSQMKLTENSVKGLASAIGESLAPAFLAINEAVRDVVRWMTDLARAVPGLTTAITINAAAFGGLLVVVGGGLTILASLIRSTALITKTMPAFGAAISAAGKLAMRGWLAFQAFLAGFEFGKWLGKVTGANAYWTEEFGRFFERWGLFQSKVDEMEVSAERLARRQLYLGTASQIAGRDITDLGKAVDIVKKRFAETGDTGNEALNKLLASFDRTKVPAKAFAEEVGEMFSGLKNFISLIPGAEKAIDGLGDNLSSAFNKIPGFKKWWDDLGSKMKGISPAAKAAAASLEAIFTTYEIEKRSAIEGKLHDAKIALKDLIAAGKDVSTPGAIQVLKDAINELNNYLYDTEARIEKVGKSLETLKKQSQDAADFFEDMWKSADAVENLKIVGPLSDEQVSDFASALDEIEKMVNDFMNEGAKASQAATDKINEFIKALRTTGDAGNELALLQLALEQVGDSLSTEAWAALLEQIKKVKQEIADSTPWGRFVVKMTNAMKTIEQVWAGVSTAMSAVSAQAQRNAEIRIDNEYKKRVDFINKTVKDEAAKNEALQALEAEYQIKKTEAQRSAAKTSKAVSLMEAVVNTASAVTSALKVFPPWLGMVFAGIVGALGAVQVALIAKQPIPLAKGAAFEKPTLIENALVGEAGPEYLLPEKKLASIVRDAIFPHFTGVPAMQAAGAGGPSVTWNQNGPLLSTTGVSRRDLEAAGEEMTKIMNRQLRRVSRRK